jgi:DHA1 family bicyclomycin/chloramphenicol resistance-like MFS transporter
MLKPLRQAEFVALMALLFATVAISIDAMLPALPQIAASLSPNAPNRAQLVITAFVFGMGLGTLFVGPLADAFGRKPVMIWGAGLYIIGALACYFANSLEMLLLARVLQGLGAAAPRVVGTAMIRDQYKGRDMARILSLVMMIFTIVPAIAPLMGQAVIHFAGYHAIFLVYIVFSVVTMAWLILRQPETLAQARPLSVVSLLQAARELANSKTVISVTLTQSLLLAALFSTLSSQQSIFEMQFNLAASFPMWFAVIALASALGSVINARIVMRLGMARVVTVSIAGMFILSVLVTLANIAGIFAFPLHLLWSIAMFALMALSMGNLNAMAMEKVGHIAGMASSMITAISTVISVILAIPVGLAFNGTALPLYLGVAGFMALGALTLRIAR